MVFGGPVRIRKFSNKEMNKLCSRLFNFYKNMISISLFRTGRLDLKKIHSQKLSEKIAFVGFVFAQSEARVYVGWWRKGTVPSSPTAGRCGKGSGS